MLRYDVCVVGFGPTGAVLAALLGKAGHRVLVVDRLADVYDKPRAIALDHEIMRVFQELGMIESIAPHVAVYPPSEYRGVDGRVIKRLDAAPPPLPLGYPPNLSFTQPPVEAALRTCARDNPNLDVRLGYELVAMRQDKAGVSINLRSPERTLDEVRTRYVIGCDGANSTVRRLTAIELDDLDFDEPWLVVDVRVSERALARLPDVNVQFCEPARPATYVVGPGNHRRWEIMLHEDEDPAEAVADEAVWALLERWIKPHEAELWRSATYRFHALVAEPWRIGRIFIAGDAAHQQPPFLGQGMCQGIRDAVNLSWKLDLVMRGHADEALLDTYGMERSEHVRKLMETVRSLGRFVCERDVVKARARDAALIAEMGGTVKTASRQDLMPRLSRGFLCPDNNLAAGSIFPQPRLVNERLLDEESGRGFRLMLSPKLSFERLKDVQLLPDMKVIRILTERRVDNDDIEGVQTVVESEGLAARWFSDHNCEAALVRPDHYVFGTASDENGVAELLAAAAAKLMSGDKVSTMACEL